MGTEVQIYGGQQVIRNLQDLMQVSEVLVKSGMLPKAIDNPFKASAVIMKGMELGIPPMTSFDMIDQIQGKTALKPQAMLALARRTNQLEDFSVSDDGTTCTVTMKRRGQSPIVSKFGMEQAKAMGLVGKDNWVKQPAVMRQWRAIAACARLVFPDVIGGMYTNEELGAVIDEEGNIVEEAQVVATRVLQEASAESSPIVDTTPTSPKAPALGVDVVSKDYAKGALVYRDVNNRVQVQIGERWYYAQDKVVMGQALNKSILALFSNEFEMKGHIKKHFGKDGLPSLTYEELAGLIAFKKYAQPDERWYPDVIDSVGVEAELATQYDKRLDVLIEKHGWNMDKDGEGLLNLSQLLHDDVVKFDSPEFWSLVGDAKS